MWEDGFERVGRDFQGRIADLHGQGKEDAGRRGVPLLTAYSEMS